MVTYKQMWKRTSKTEIRDLFKSLIVLSFCYSIIVRGFSLSLNPVVLISEIIRIIPTLFYSALVIGVAFIFHELAHKFVAQHYGCLAEFRSNNRMLVFAIFFTLLFRFIFFAPGAVMIFGKVTKRENGHISLAGPLTNYILGIISLSLFIPFKLQLFGMAALINFFIGAFNMIPFGMFDGKKIYRWNNVVYFTMLGFGIAAIYYSFSYVVPYLV